MKKHIWEIHLAILLLSGVGVFAKVISLSSTQIIFFRLIIASIALYIFMYLTKKQFKLKSAKDYLWSALCGVFLTLHWISIFYSAKISTVAISYISLFTYPLFVIFLEPLFFKTKLQYRDVFSGLIVLVGVYFLIPDFTFKNTYFLGVVYGVLSALLYSFRFILTKKHLSNNSSLTTMIHQMFAGIILLLPFLFTWDITFQKYDLLYLILLGVFATAIAHVLIIDSVFKLKAKTAAIITSIQPIYAIILAAILLQETPTVKVLVGGMLILIAVTIESMTHTK